MGLFDIALLLEPLPGDSPTGEDLEYDNAFTELELNAQGTPDRVELVKDPDDYDGRRVLEKIIPGKEPNAKEILDAALALFKRTKDLRVAVYIAHSATRIDGLPGLASGTQLVLSLLEQYWDQVHPRLEPDDPDPFMRVNILNGFNDPAKLLKAVKNVPFAEARAIGRFTLRDLDVASGDTNPLEGQTAATPELLRATCAETDQAVLSERFAACKAALGNLAAILKIFREQTTSYPDFGLLKKSLERAVAIYETVAQSSAEPELVEAINPEDGSATIVRSANTNGKISSRSDVKRVLEQVCTYFEQSEPAHPSPLLIRRAIRLLDMSFLDIMQELNPASVSELEQLGGIKRD